MKSTSAATIGLSLILALSVSPSSAEQSGSVSVTADNEAQIMNIGGVNTPYSEYTPFITADERYLFFQSNRPGGITQTGDYDLWYTENEVTEGTPKFKPPANVGLPVNSDDFDGHPSLRKLPTGEYEMYFASFSGEGRSGPQLTNIYYTIFKNNKWLVPVPVVEINTDFHDRMPSISQDGHYLFFSSDRPGGFGKDDIWVSEYDFAAKRWGKPHNAGRSINTPAAEVTPAIHSDNITLYFSSDRAGGVGGYDIYVTQMVQDMPAAAMTGGDTESMWKKPVNLGKPYNSTFDDEYPTVIRSGTHMYFASNRENGQGAFDIYRARVPEFAKPEVVVTLKGRVKEKFSDKGIEANIRISDAEGERNFSTHQPEGLYSANLINKKQYKIVVTAPGYQPIEYIADLRDIHTPVTVQKDFEMERVLALPKDITINVVFVDEKGKPVKPNATYRLMPEMQDDSVLPFKNGKGKVTVAAMSKFKKAEDALAALDGMKLAVKANKQGFEDLGEERSLADLIRGKNGEFVTVAELKLVMKEKGGMTVVRKCNKGDNCIGIAYFPTNISNRMNNEKDAGLNYVAELWNKQPHKYIYLHGHADSRGPKAHNMKLSRARAQFVKRKLVRMGIPDEMIITKGYGATQRASRDESTVEGRRLNRRVEIFFETTKRAGDEKDEEVKPAPESPGGAAKPAAKKKKGKTKPLPPEEVEPSVKPKTEAKPQPETKAETEEPATPAEVTKPEGEVQPAEKPAEAAEVKPAETSGFSQPAKPAEKPISPTAPNTEIKIK